MAVGSLRRNSEVRGNTTYDNKEGEKVDPLSWSF